MLTETSSLHGGHGPIGSFVWLHTAPLSFMGPVSVRSSSPGIGDFVLNSAGLSTGLGRKITPGPHTAWDTMEPVTCGVFLFLRS